MLQINLCKQNSLVKFLDSISELQIGSQIYSTIMLDHLNILERYTQNKEEVRGLRSRLAEFISNVSDPVRLALLNFDMALLDVLLQERTNCSLSSAISAFISNIEPRRLRFDLIGHLTAKCNQISKLFPLETESINHLYQFTLQNASNCDAKALFKLKSSYGIWLGAQGRPMLAASIREF